MFWLGRREARQVARDKASLIAQFGSTAFLYVIIGNIFSGAADYSDMAVHANDPVAQNAEIFQTTTTHFGVVTFIATGAMFGLAQPTMLSFPQERPIFLREYASGQYGAAPYFLSKVLVEVPKSFAVVLFIYLISFWIIDFQGSFVVLVLVTTLFGLVASSVSLLIGSLASNVQVGVQLTPLLFVPQLLFSGFYIPISQIPGWLRWAQYLCSLKYALNLLVVEEMKGLPPSWPEEVSATLYYRNVYGCDAVADHECAAGATPVGTALFPKVDVSPNDTLFYYGVLIAIFLGFRGMALYFLTVRARR